MPVDRISFFDEPDVIPLPGPVPEKPLNGHPAFADIPPPPAVTPAANSNGEILPPEFADDGLALQFSFHFGGALRYVDAWGTWMAWDGTIWRRDDTLRVYDLVRRICRRASSETAHAALQKQLTSGKTIAAVEKLSRSDRRHAATAQQWDADPWKLNTPRGIVDLTSGEFMPHDPMHHMTKTAAASPCGDCPKWLKFLKDVTAGNTELQGYLQRVVGYSLTGSVREQAMFFAYGTGGNGKGTFLNTIQAIMGDYAVVASAETFTSTTQPRHLTELARLQGARLVVAQETEEGKQLAEARVKAITGGDPITANFMRQDPFTYFPQFKLFISGNHKPALRNVDEAMRRRFNLIPFEVQISAADRDPDLFENLKPEWPGILQWMVEGCLEWQQSRLRPPVAVQAATSDYFESEDALAQWMEETCVISTYSEEESANLFKSWDGWARRSGESAGSQKRFSQALLSRGFKTKKLGQGKRGFTGLELRKPRPPTETADEGAD